VVADRETRRLSFGSVATDYDRYRPPPPPQALDWLIPPAAQAILDLAAGTGVVTRELIGRAARVVAVEPDERMRAVLAAAARRPRCWPGGARISRCPPRPWTPW
jgi:SAM-dependent methyltransferase